MVGVRVIDYRLNDNGIEKVQEYRASSKKPILLIERNDSAPDRISREEFVKLKSCIPTVTRFEITKLGVVTAWVYDEETNMMIKEENNNE